MLTPAQKASYEENGWLVVPGLFSTAACDEMAELAVRLARAELRAGAPGMQVEGGPLGSEARKLDKPFTRDKAFRDFVLSGEMAAVTGELMGATAVLCTDQIFMKPPLMGTAKPWHQDNGYFKCEPATQVITSWIALDDVDEGNGCLYYLKGSHKMPILPHEPVPGEPYNLTPPVALLKGLQAIPVPVPKGGVIFHHSHSLHGSPANASPRWRRGYATHWVSRAVTSSTPLLEKAYFTLPEYAHLFPAA
jgi:phytanoyl-CoA hydroxylase